MKDSRERFNRWSPTYELDWTWRRYFSPLHRTLVEEAGEVKGLRVLDLGCGTGGLLRRFARAGAGRLVGIDPSEGMLEVASRSAEGDGCFRFIKTAAESIPLEDGAFDLAVSCIAFHHFPDPRRALAETERLMVPGGRLLLCDLCGEGLGSRIMLAWAKRVSVDERYFTRDELAEMMTGVGLSVDRKTMLRKIPPTMLLDSSKPPIP